MSDDALAYLVEAFGHVSDAEVRSYLDGTPAPHILPESSEVAPVVALPAEAREPARAA